MQSERPQLHTIPMTDVAIVGAGFTGLSAALELARKGLKVTVVEKDSEPGGLAGSFAVANQRLEKFYHHWFTSDQHIMSLVRSLGREQDVLWHPTRTGMYFAHRLFRLSRPRDVLAFTPLSFQNRLRLGYMTLAARRIKNWRELEGVTAKEWLLKLGGEQVYRVVWEPLLVGKFGEYAEEVSAVWLWNKLKLRGGSRGRAGQEVLAYYKGGFSALASQIKDAIEKCGGEVQLNTAVRAISTSAGQVNGLNTAKGFIPARSVLLTVPLPMAADLVAPITPGGYTESLRRIRYLSNICIVLELNRSLSSMYWLNVNDPSFPFVGVIEHTNFEPASTYGGKHIVYLSKYLPRSAELYRMSNEDAVKVAVDALKRMFPEFERDAIEKAHVWRADYAQPLVERRYSRLVPDFITPIKNLFLSSMAQVYPEDRGTNYAVRNGSQAAQEIAASLRNPAPKVLTTTA
jgi:protoporphyrinogen oxidase